MNDSTSDNANYVAYASASALSSATSDDRICARFWSHVHKNGPVHSVLGTRCWLWTGALTGGSSVRHGQVMWRARYRTPQKAHRIAWELTHGPILSGQQALHHCDNPICCNPAHLYLGTHLDNMRDASVRGRFTVPKTRKLSLFQRLTIYQTPAYPGVGVALAQRYGVTKACISTIRRGRFLGSGVWTGTKTAPLIQALAELAGAGVEVTTHISLVSRRTA